MTVEYEDDDVVYEGDDCCTFVASWWAAATGTDPARNYRGSYSTPEEAREILENNGGARGLCENLLEMHGGIRIQNVQDGDVGIIRVQTYVLGSVPRFEEVPAVCYGPLWGMMSLRGVMVKKAEYMGVAWRPSIV